MKVVLLEIKDMSASYRKREVIKHCDVSLGEGKLAAPLGLNGSDKTTILKTSCELLREGSTVW